MKKPYKKRKGGKMPGNDDDEEDRTQATRSQVDSDDDDVPSMRELMNRYNRLLERPTPRNAVVYPEVGINTPPGYITPDDDDDGDFIERDVFRPPPRLNRLRTRSDLEEPDEEFEPPEFRREHALNAREFRNRFPHMSDSESDEENDNEMNNRQGGRRRKTTKKRKTIRRIRRRKTTRKHYKKRKTSKNTKI